MEEYNRRNIAFPLLDHLIQQMNDQFGKTQAVKVNSIHLVPSVISIHHNKSSKELTSFNSNDLPSVSLAPTEVVWKWKTKWQTEDPEK